MAIGYRAIYAVHAQSSVDEFLPHAVSVDSLRWILEFVSHSIIHGIYNTTEV